MKYIDADKLRAEIERKLKFDTRVKTSYYIGKRDAENEILSFLDTLQEPEVELEKEIEKQWKRCNPIDEGMGVESANIHIEAFDIIAKHFYSLGQRASDNVPKIKGWVARDKYTGHLVIYNNSDCWGHGLDVINLPGEWWRLCTTDAPREVELIVQEL